HNAVAQLAEKTPRACDQNVLSARHTASSNTAASYGFSITGAFGNCLAWTSSTRMPVRKTNGVPLAESRAATPRLLQSGPLNFTSSTATSKSGLARSNVSASDTVATQATCAAPDSSRVCWISSAIRNSSSSTRQRLPTSTLSGSTKDWFSNGTFPLSYELRDRAFKNDIGRENSWSDARYVTLLAPRANALSARDLR